MIKFILALVVFLAASPAFAESWYIVNVVLDDAPACTLMDKPLDALLADARGRYGKDSVATYPETYKDGSRFIGVVVDRPNEGPIQIPLASSIATCKKVMGNVAKVEKVLEARRREVGEPWYFMSTAYNECVKASLIFKNAYTPELYAKMAAAAHRPVSINYNEDKSVAILTDNNGAIIPMMRGETLCKLGLAKVRATR